MKIAMSRCRSAGKLSVIAATLVISMCLASCAVPPLSGDPANNADLMSSNAEPSPALVTPAPTGPMTAILQTPRAFLVPVYFATDRKWLTESNTFGPEPNLDKPHMTYGSILVSIPVEREVGAIPIPFWYNIFSKNDERKYVLLRGMQKLSSEKFFYALRDAVQANSGGKRASFIYIHGYNNSFDDAARRAGQIAVDLDLPVVPVFYSWPSRAKAKDYPDDEDSALWTQSHLMNFLSDFADRTTTTDIYIIAHSMGNRPTTLALATLLEKRPDLRVRFKQLILAAPDINAEVFKDDIAPRFAKLRTPVTVYASKNDKALRLSYEFHNWRRIGDAGDAPPSMPGVDMIDASSINTNFMGHDYFASNRALLTDVSYLLRTGASARDRSGLRGKPAANPLTWAFP